MRVFVAGATGAMGVPLVRRLLAAGHRVTGLTRTPEKRALLGALGAEAAVADALDAPALTAALEAARPDAVVHLLTALPKSGPRRAGDLDATNRLRVEGTRNLIDAAVAAGAKRFLAESVVFVYGYGDRSTELLTEESPLPKPAAGLDQTVAAGLALEQQVLAAARAGRIEGIVLRYGLIYGPTAGSTAFTIENLRRRAMPIVKPGTAFVSWVHAEDAAEAVVAALVHGRAGEVYNIVDDEPVQWRDFLPALAKAAGAPKPWTVPQWVAKLFFPYGARVLATSLRISNAKAKRELGWKLRYPTFREGVHAAEADPGGSSAG